MDLGYRYRVDRRGTFPLRDDPGPVPRNPPPHRRLRFLTEAS